MLARRARAQIYSSRNYYYTINNSYNMIVTLLEGLWSGGGIQ